MENQIAKPLSIAKAEFVHHLTDLINNSGLPMLVIEYVLKDMCSDVHALSQRQLELDIKSYNDAVSGINNTVTSDKN